MRCASVGNLSNMGAKIGAVAIGVSAALTALVVATPAAAQISSQQVRERYDKNTKSVNTENFARAIESDDPMKRLEGIKSLTSLKDDRALEYLLQALGDSDVRVKAKAIDTCGNLRATDATPVLIQQLFLRGTDPAVEQRILAALGKIGDPRAARPIMEYLQRDLDQAARGTAIFALGDLAAPESLDMLAEIERTDPDPTLQRLAREAASKVRYHQAMQKTEAKQPLDTFLRPEQPPGQ